MATPRSRAGNHLTRQSAPQTRQLEKIELLVGQNGFTLPLQGPEG